MKNDAFQSQNINLLKQCTIPSSNHYSRIFKRNSCKITIHYINRLTSVTIADF